MVTPVFDKEDVLQRLHDARNEILARGVLKLGLFGSFVRGNADAESDVDFLVQFAPPMKCFDNFMSLSSLLEDVLRRPVELVTTEAISPHMGPHILSEVENVPLDE